MTKTMSNRLMFLMEKVDYINRTTDHKATFNLSKESLGIYVDQDPKNHETLMCEFIYFEYGEELTEEKVYEIYMELDEVEKSTADDDAQNGQVTEE